MTADRDQALGIVQRVSGEMAVIAERTPEYISQENLAALVNAIPESVRRTLGEMAADGIKGQYANSLNNHGDINAYRWGFIGECLGIEAITKIKNLPAEGEVSEKNRRLRATKAAHLILTAAQIFPGDPQKAVEWFNHDARKGLEAAASDNQPIYTRTHAVADVRITPDSMADAFGIILDCAK